MHRIIVVGGGAGGLELVTRLGDRYGAGARGKGTKGAKKDPAMSVTLVDRNPTHLWKPLLHEVAAGSLDPFTHQLAYAAQALWHGFDFQQGELLGLDRTARTIALAPLIDEDGIELLPQRLLHYDTLVLAIGSTTHFFGVPGAEQHAMALDTVAQAERFRRRLISACMRAQAEAPPAIPAAGPEMMLPDGRPRIEIAIVGGGATGIELSAELRNTAHVLAAYGLHKLDPRHDIGIVVIEGSSRILPALPERVAAATTDLLTKLGVELMVGETVAQVDAQSLRTASGKVLRADLTIWAAGIKAPAVLAQLDGLPVNRLGQLCVRPTLQTDADDAIFALGDCASCPWPAAQRTVPPRAQAAHQQASFLLHALACRLGGRPLPSFAYRDFGSLVSLGHFSAVGNLMGGLIGKNFLVEGLFARFMYTSLYRLHLAALYGWPRMLLDTLAHWLRRSTVPRVKLH